MQCPEAAPYVVAPEARLYPLGRDVPEKGKRRRREGEEKEKEKEKDESQYIVINMNILMHEKNTQAHTVVL